MNLNEMLDNALKVGYTMCYHLNDFTIAQLSELAELAKKKEVEIRIRAEHSNVAQGTLVELQRRKNRVQRIDLREN